MADSNPAVAPQDNKEHKGPSFLEKIEKNLEKLDFAEERVPQTYDPALDPSLQHTHPHHVHEGAGRGDDHIKYVPNGIPGRIDPNDVPHDNNFKESFGNEDAIGPVSSDYERTKHEAKQETKHSVVCSEVEPKGTNGPIDYSEKSLSDLESGTSDNKSEQPKLLPMERAKLAYRRHKWVISLLVGLLFTSWWISILAQPQHRHEWLIPTFIWLFLTIRLITFYVPTRPLLMMVNWVWVRTFIPFRNLIPEKFWVPLEGLCLVITVLVATFATPETPESLRKDRAVSFFGYVVIYFSFFLISNQKRRIRWHTIVWGMFLQFAIALFVLRTKAGYDFFTWISFLARKLLSFSGDGAAFLTSQSFVGEGWFIITTLCSVLFFIAFIHIWYYFGVIQWLVGKFAIGCYWLLRISGAESVVVAATPFVGQGESAVLVKPFMPHCTEAEIFQILTSGFSTVSGSVLASYIHMGVNLAALITSCVMSIPASVAASKLVHPETEESLTADRVVVPEDATEEAHNVIHAFSNGAVFGLNVALSMGANILCIIALVALINALLTYFGKFWGIPQLTLEQIMGYIFYPVAFLLGASRDGDLYKVGKLLGVKIIQNEFVAFQALNNSPEYMAMSNRSKILATYGLCGFSNLGSCGIQLGVLTTMAPTRRGTIAKYLLFTMLVGCFCTFTSAAVAGMLMTNLSELSSSAE